MIGDYRLGIDPEGMLQMVGDFVTTGQKAFGDFRIDCLRITSYNVCYTKLLRTEATVDTVFGRKSGFEQFFALFRSDAGTVILYMDSDLVVHNVGTHGDHTLVLNRLQSIFYEIKQDLLQKSRIGRITSYNVCYTKLLRRNSHFSEVK